MFKNCFAMLKNCRASLFFFLGLFVPAPAFSAEELHKLSIEELLDIEVSSVAKKSQRLAVSPAAVYVISSDQIIRSGVTNLADALRLAPGISVGQIDSNKWSVSSRGFSGRYSNKLLVLLDGRSLYNTSFAGVYWEAVNIPLDEIERIEVIRGPGGTLWGANAVNGVINIISKHSSESQGNRVAVTLGNTEQGTVYFRQGREWEGHKSVYSRYYFKVRKVDNYNFLNGDSARDDWSAFETGFRLDADRSEDGIFVLHGGVSSYNFNQRVRISGATDIPFSDDEVKSRGIFFLGKWSGYKGGGAHSSLQLYYDFYVRDGVHGLEKNHTLDVEYQQNLALGSSHDIVWGIGLRGVVSELGSSEYRFYGNEISYPYLGSGFLQDEITLLEDVFWLTVGSKFEYNRYTGLEIQPTLRALWSVGLGHKVWGAVSKAVRTPSRSGREGVFRISTFPGVEESFFMPVELDVYGSSSFESEELIATEVGYRYRPTSSAYIDLALFYNQYEGLRGFKSESVFDNNKITHKLTHRNAVAQDTYGGELSAIVELGDDARMDFSYTRFYGEKPDVNDMHLSQDYNSRDTEEFMLALEKKLPRSLSLSIWFTYNTSLVMTDARNTSYTYKRDGYFDWHAGIMWGPQKGVKFSLVARNLGDKEHLEYLQEGYSGFTEIPSSFSLNGQIDF